MSHKFSCRPSSPALPARGERQDRDLPPHGQKPGADHFPRGGPRPAVVGFQLFSPSFSRSAGAGPVSGFAFRVDPLVAGSGMDGNGQDRGRKAVEESVATVENQSLEPRKREAVGGSLVSG